MGKTSKLRNSWCAVELSAAAVVAAQAVSPGDKHALREASGTSIAEIRLGRIAQRNALPRKSVATSLGGACLPDHSANGKALVAELKLLVCRILDRTYFSTVIKAHRQPLEGARNEMNFATHPKIEPVAGEGEPLIAEHLRQAEPVARNHRIHVTN